MKKIDDPLQNDFGTVSQNIGLKNTGPESCFDSTSLLFFDKC